MLLVSPASESQHLASAGLWERPSFLSLSVTDHEVWVPWHQESPGLQAASPSSVSSPHGLASSQGCL